MHICTQCLRCAWSSKINVSVSFKSEIKEIKMYILHSTLSRFKMQEGGNLEGLNMKCK